MQQHINRLTEIVAQLAGVGETITDRSIAITLLDSLPKSYDMLKVSLGNIPEKITAELVKTRALQEEARLKEETEGDENESTALISNKKKGKGKRKEDSPKKSRPKCEHCKKVGHQKDGCW